MDVLGGRLLAAMVTALGALGIWHGLRGERPQHNFGLSEILLAKLPLNVWRVVMTSMGVGIFLSGLVFVIRGA